MSDKIRKQDTVSFEQCPRCSWSSIRVTNGKVARHERGLGYVPYDLYKRFARAKLDDLNMTVHNQVKRNLCPASGEDYIYLIG